MPIDKLHSEALGRTRHLMPQVFAGAGNKDGSADEDRRRRTTDAVVTPASIPASSPTPVAGTNGARGQSGAQGPKGDKGDKGDAGPPGPVIDRLHKYASNPYGAYIFVSLDHDALDIDQVPPTNPGFRSVAATASSLNDAYQKALEITLQPDFSSAARVVIYVLDGIWNEALICTSDRIDLIGFGRPRINGRIIVTETATVFRMENFEVVNDIITVGAADPSITVLPGPVVNLPYSSVQFRNVWAHNPQRAFVAYRRVYCEECWFWSDTIYDLSVEMAPLEVYASVNSEVHVWVNDWSVFKNCRMFGFTDIEQTDEGFPPEGGRNSFGYAIKASTYIDGNYIGLAFVEPGLTQQGGSYYTLPNSGVKLEGCRIDGILLCDVSTVKHDNCECISAIPNSAVKQEPYGGVYAVIRGVGITIAEDPPLDVQIPGRVFWDNSHVYSSRIGVFVDAPGFTPGFGATARPWGGAGHFRHSIHSCQYGPVNRPGPPDDSAFVSFTAPGEVFHDLFSSTAYTVWAGIGVTPAPDNTTGTNQLPAAVYDPYLI